MQEGQLSYEEAIIAKKRNVEENRRIAKKFRNESEKLMQQYFEQRHEDQQEMRRLVEATMRGHHNTQLMKDKLTAMKRKIGKEEKLSKEVKIHNLSVHSTCCTLLNFTDEQ